MRSASKSPPRNKFLENFRLNPWNNQKQNRLSKSPKRSVNRLAMAMERNNRHKRALSLATAADLKRKKA